MLRRSHSKDAFVDSLPPILRAAHDLLHHCERDLRLARCSLRDSRDSILDVTSTKLLQAERRKVSEVTERLQAAVIGAGADPLLVALEPAGKEHAKRLGLRLVQRPELLAPLQIEAEVLR